uniref:Uncharacterized protein n=1 Tax=Rhizophora mucronata TaxID=61149 RepID=A0A2P2JD16_RHIMU
MSSLLYLLISKMLWDVFLQIFCSFTSYLLSELPHSYVDWIIKICLF